MSPLREESDASRHPDEELVLLPRRSDGRPLRVLVVEDEGFVALDLVAHLEEWGADARVTPTTKMALRMLAEMRPDLVLLDVRLPDGDGVQLAAAIRGLSDAPVVFVTAVDTPATLARIRSLGDLPAKTRKPSPMSSSRMSSDQ